MDSSEQLVQVTAPHFCAGIVLKNGVVTEAAPILKWTIGKQKEWLSTYFKQKGWTEEMVKEEDKKPWVPQVITGGKEPPIITGSNWLIGMEMGTVFWAKKKPSPNRNLPQNIMEDMILQTFRLDFKKGRGVVLTNPETGDRLSLDSDAFCNHFIKYEELEVAVDV